MEPIKLKISRKKIILWFLTVLYTVRAYTDAIYVSQQLNSGWTSLKYLVLLLMFAYGVIYISKKHLPWKNLKCVKCVALAGGAIALITCFKMIYTGHYSFEVFEFVIHLLIPAVSVVIISSIATPEELYDCFCWILCICFAVYCVFEIGLPYFTSGNIGMISFKLSYSPYESHYTSGTAGALCAYFSYYRQKKKFTYLSLLFSLLTFKRMIVIWSITLFVLPIIIDVTHRVTKRIPRLCGLGFCVLTLVYYWFLIPENQNTLQELLKVDSVHEFTSGRNNFFAAVYNSPFFVNFGWGACEALLGRTLEMELIQMLVEVGIMGLGIFVLAYWELAGTTIFGIVYMAFNFLNMLTSHSVENGFVWILVLLTFTQIETTENNHLRLKKIKVKFR